MRLKEGGYLGTVQTTIFGERVAEIAYTLPSRYWGRGYATEACCAMIGVLLNDYAPTKIVARIDARNDRSIALAQRLGLTQTQYIRGAELIQGELADEVIYTLVVNSHIA